MACLPWTSCQPCALSVGQLTFCSSLCIVYGDAACLRFRLHRIESYLPYWFHTDNSIFPQLTYERIFSGPACGARINAVNAIEVATIQSVSSSAIVVSTTVPVSELMWHTSASMSLFSKIWILQVFQMYPTRHRLAAESVPRSHIWSLGTYSVLRVLGCISGSSQGRMLGTRFGARPCR